MREKPPCPGCCIPVVDAAAEEGIRLWRKQSVWIGGAFVIVAVTWGTSSIADVVGGYGVGETSVASSTDAVPVPTVIVFRQDDSPSAGRPSRSPTQSDGMLSAKAHAGGATGRGSGPASAAPWRAERALGLSILQQVTSFVENRRAVRVRGLSLLVCNGAKVRPKWPHYSGYPDGTRYEKPETEVERSYARGVVRGASGTSCSGRVFHEHHRGHGAAALPPFSAAFWQRAAIAATTFDQVGVTDEAGRWSERFLSVWQWKAIQAVLFEKVSVESLRSSTSDSV